MTIFCPCNQKKRRNKIFEGNFISTIEGTSTKRFDKNEERENSSEDSSSTKPKRSIFMWRNNRSSDKLGATPVSFIGLFRFASKSDRRLVYLGIFFAVFVGAVQPLSMFLNGKVADILIAYRNETSEESEQFLRKGFTFVVISGVTGFGLIAFSFAQFFFLRLACIDITNTLRARFIESILRQDAKFFDERKFGAINAQLNSNIERINDGIGDKIGVLMRGVASFVSAMLVAFFVNWKITLSICAVGPICALVMASTPWAVSRTTKRYLSATESASAVLQEALMNVRTVQSCNGERTMVKRFAQRLADGRLYAILQYVWNGVFDGLFFFTLYIFNAISSYYGAWRFIDGEASGGDVLIVTNLVILGAYYLGSMSPYIACILKARVAAAVIYEQIDRVPERIDVYSARGIILGNSKCEISFRDVYFSYSSNDKQQRSPVLNGLSWSAASGESVALVGHSGSGKSTCMSLITRLYECDSGRVEINDVDVKDLNLQSLRSAIGIVPQEPVLFNGTIFENVALGDSSISLARVKEVCRIANAYEFIAKLEKGFFTQIGSGHVYLSGGQKQRLAIARALVKDPPILLLDEATSALDAESEILVQNALESASKGRTTVIIAHRLSTLRNVDKIIVIDQGKVVETGTHQELCCAKSEGIYAKLVQSQSFDHINGECDEASPDQLAAGVSVELPEINSEYDRFKSPLGEELNSRRDHSFSEPGSFIGRNHANSTSLTVADNEEEIEQIKNSQRAYKSSIWQIYGNVDGNYGKLFLCLVFSLLRGLELVLYVQMMSMMFVAFADYSARRNSDNFWTEQYRIVGANVALGVFCFVTVMLASFCGWTTENVVDNLKIRAFGSVLSQDGAFFDRPQRSSAALIRRITVDAFALKAPLDYRLFNFMNNLMGVLSLIIVSFLSAWRIASVGCVVMILLSILPTYLSLRTQRRVSRQNVEVDESSKVHYETFIHLRSGSGQYKLDIVVEIIENVRTIQLLTKEKYFHGKYLEKLQLLRHPTVVTATFDAAIFALVQSFLFISDFFCFGMGIIAVYNGLNAPNDVFVASMNVGTASFCVLFISTSLSDILRAKPSADSIFELINAKPKISEGELTEIGDGSVEISAVEFAYPARPAHKVANRLTLRVSGGESVALVGPSGGGKSTVISLLERFYAPNRGSIKIGGTNIELVSLTALRNRIALVSQEPVLFSGTIFDNVRLGVEDTTGMEDVIAACAMANAKSFIECFPLGYLTEVGEKSSQLSGGQKQRIAIARALVRKPKILLLDEATSALDAHSEQAVQQALSLAECGRSCITIAHRLSSIQHADRIYFIRNGRVVESGTYTELMNNSESAFAQMVAKQQLK